MTRFYASLALLSLGMMAAPAVIRTARFARAATEHAATTAADSLLNSRSPEQAAIDVVECVVEDISR